MIDCKGFDKMEMNMQQVVFFLRILAACVCGGIIGYERKNRGKEAGIRTHAIVALSAALMMIISKYGFSDLVDYPGVRGADPARIAAQVVSGVGFLGAGMIYFNRHLVKGLTTAAGVWATAGVGLAMGSGMYIMGAIATLMIVLLQVILHKNYKIFNMPNEETISISIDDNEESMNFVNSLLAKYDITVGGIKCRRKGGVMEMEMDVFMPRDIDCNMFLQVFRDSKFIHSINI